ncbi:tRNA uridine-5-carboxymethylaminomethyl(34) synthesis enzyme MnmG [Peptoniphilus sp. KCTC 25270]|uniref:tRNA uridine-5-carboxymethylaminomethyl(34) synthesis enzyme MnmG n=1 Tax=Peptoniphilus sp. KCTC 25270 TaxID=2897414 RepID=UPI001E4488B5|nr:tRNA uridine-5-carboxymethylaminomethyl(34) synthesis enzyme MnmG [Peptoniphilus sp. KCTC 25270]MCD1147904.1 tRNA uridine-5-carboxymethylaminomethyl(34) synthesis enzyme MnmG [Peptoniphilus sp. KCTC 25270]
MINRFNAGSVDVLVVGAGHAGTEAALASARMGLKTALLTMNLNSIVAMSCNPNVGGTGKGHLVREIDALGGEMGKNIDRTFIQSRMLNLSKGPAVHSLRAQADKRQYHVEMKQVIENQENLLLIQEEVIELLIEEGKIYGVLTRTGAEYHAKAVVMATGTYLRGRVFMGEVNYSSGPDGMQPSIDLSENLREKWNIETMRMKTGTPARVHRDTIDFTNLEVQKGDEKIVPFSFMNLNKDFSEKEQINCYLTYTTSKSHDIIRENIHRSAMSLGDIEGSGPRYCPSIEDKVTRFADRDRHQVFLEPEGLDTKEIYVQGVSSSLPVEVQLALYKEIEGLENCQFMRPAYAIEYDAIDATLLNRNLEMREIKGLFMAGQINGSSGYEEAASQGLMAGINAALSVQGKDPLILDRSQGYIGVLIDDLVTKGTKEPYRMMTSRAEYRLTLRQDNADLRLTEIGHEIGLVDEERYKEYLYRKEEIEEELSRLESIQINPTEENNKKLEEIGSAKIRNAITLADLLQRPELNYKKVSVFDPNRPERRQDVVEEVSIMIRYKGYIEKQKAQIRQFERLENRLLPENIDYTKIEGLRNEAKEKLMKIRPESLGQANRITGISPADINVLLVYFEQKRREKKD